MNSVLILFINTDPTLSRASVHSLPQKCQEFQVTFLIKCRENTIDGGKEHLSLYRQTVPSNEKRRHERVCSLLCRNSAWQSVFEPSNSGCALLDQLFIPKDVTDIKKNDSFFKRKAFPEKKTKKKYYTLHILTLTNTAAENERSINFLLNCHDS